MRTIVYYYDRNKVDAKIIQNMFRNYRCERLFPVWDILFRYQREQKMLDFDIVEVLYTQISKSIEDEMRRYSGEKIQVIIYGADKGIYKICNYIIGKYSDIDIKIISSVYEGLIFDEYNMKNFHKVLKLLKEGKIKKLYFFKKGIVDAYKKMGYNVGYIMQNYELPCSDNFLGNEKDNNINNDNYKNQHKEENTKKVIGVFPAGDNWNNNIYNQFSIPCFVEGGILKYNVQSKRDVDFVKTHNIDSIPVFIQNDNLELLTSNIYTSDIVLDLDFTANFNINFLIAAELGKLCLIGNNNDLFDDLPFKYSDMIITNSEDNSYENAKQISKLLEDNENISEIQTELKRWKTEYNNIQKENLKKIIEE